MAIRTLLKEGSSEETRVALAVEDDYRNFPRTNVTGSLAEDNLNKFKGVGALRDEGFDVNNLPYGSVFTLRRVEFD